MEVVVEDVCKESCSGANFSVGEQRPFSDGIFREVPSPTTTEPILSHWPPTDGNTSKPIWKAFKLILSMYVQ